MLYLLDTNICIRYLNQRSEILIQKLASQDPRNVVVCSVVKAELFFGAMKSNNPQQSLQKQEAFLAPYVSLPFDDMAAITYADIRAHLEQQGTPIGPNDLLIAAIALAHDLTLVTNNIREFSRVPRLRFEDWDTSDE